MAIPLRLKVFKGEELIATRDFERDMIKIGRLSTAHLCLDDEKASRIHSVLNVETDGKLSIVDMGSVEGTYLNGKRVNKGQVAFGDEIRIGNTRIIVEQGQAENVVENRPASDNALTVVGPPPSSEEPTMVAAIPTPPAEEPAPSVTEPAPVPAAAAAAPAAEEPAPEPEPEPEPEAHAEPPAGAIVSEMIEDGRHRTLIFADRPFGSYVPQQPQARRPASASGTLGLQIRYYWGDALLQVTQHANPESVFIGSTLRAEFKMDHSRLGALEHALVVAQGESFALNVADGMTGELDREGKRVKLSPGSHELRAQDFAYVEFGGIRAELSFTSQPRKVLVPLSESIDYRFLNMFLLTLFVAGLFVISSWMLLINASTDVVADDLNSNKMVVAKFLIKEAEKPKRNKLLENLQADKQGGGEMAEKHKGQEGKMGKQDAKPDKNKRSAPKAIDINAKEWVKNTGLLKTLGTGGGGGLSTIFGQGGLGGDIKGALGNMFGTQIGDAHGFGGLGLKGTGTGGGGTGLTIGIGGIGTKGRGGGLGGYGTGVGNLGTKKTVDPAIADSESVVQGSLDKELIRQVIKRNIGQIRYCYEMELQTKPNLAGKVAVRFVIAANGDVQSAKVAEGTTMNEPRLSECVTVRVRSWKFPSPKGGGSVIVTYPFVFKQSGD